jgi:hypothetical protein
VKPPIRRQAYRMPVALKEGYWSQPSQPRNA